MRNNHTMRLAAALTCLALLLCLAPVPAARAEAPATPSDIRQTQTASPGDAPALGYIDDGWSPPSLSASGWQSPALLGELPAKYDLRNVNGVSYMTPVRNQSPYGTCWAHATTASAESSLLKQGYKQYSDLSELHLVNYTYNRSLEVTGAAGDVSYHLSTAPIHILNFGGNEAHAITALSSRLGMVPESVAPYGNSSLRSQVLNNTLPAKYARDYNTAHLDYAYGVSLEDTEAIKTLLMESGAGTISYYYDQAYESGNRCSYYCGDSYDPNHSVTLCGWDDNYPRENFRSHPTSNGAWLCKNSWGSYNSMGGYFWISYEDATLADVYFIGMHPVEEDYDYLYEYDGGFFDHYTAESSSVVHGANVFTCTEDEMLEAVRFTLGSVNTQVTIRVYVNPNPDDPDSGELKSTTVFNCTYTGVYTIPLQIPVALRLGDTFAVAVEFSAASGAACLCRDAGYAAFGYKTSQPTALAGQSYRSDDGDSWSDMASSGNLRIKALTNSGIFIPTGVAGDVDMDSKLTINDAVLIARYIVGLDKFGRHMQKAANVDETPGVTIADVLYICKTIVGQEP